MEEDRFMRVDGIVKELDVSTFHTYRIVKRLNDEMEALGYAVVSGRVNRTFAVK